MNMTNGPTPLKPFAPAHTDEADARRNKDLELFHEWKNTGSKRALTNLIGQLEPVINKEVMRATGALPIAALRAEALSWTVKALNTYDPGRGVLISTHVSNYLPKIRRVNYKFQNAARLPENLQRSYRDYRSARDELTEQLNRDPTDKEVGAHIGWTEKQTTKFRNMLFDDLIESNAARESAYKEFNSQSIFMEHLQSQFTPEEKMIFEHHKDLSSAQMAEKLGVNVNRYNYLKSKLVDKIKNLKMEAGEY